MLFMGEEWGASTPWMYFTDHTDPAIADAVRRGRREEFGRHGWALDDVPDPQAARDVRALAARLGRAATASRTRACSRWYRDLIAAAPRAARPARPAARSRGGRRTTPRRGTVVVRRGEHVVAVNLAGEARTLALPSAGLVVVLAWDPAGVALDGAQITLGAESVAILGPRDACTIGV